MLFSSHSTSAQPARVVVTGIGLLTALGNGAEANAEGFRSGRRGFRPVTLFDVSRQRVQSAAEIDLPASWPRTRLSAHQQQRLDRAARMLLVAAAEAWTQAGWTAGVENLPVVLGTTSGGMSLGEAFYRQCVTTPTRLRGQARRVTHYQPQRQALDLMDAFGFRGPVTMIANACASGANAVGHAFTLVRTGRAERVLTGGYDALSHLVFAGFDSLQALSPTTCRPFDAHRDGLALGEGAAVLCLEAETAARRRGAEILGEVAGYGAATDIHHLTQPRPDGEAAWQTMTAACAQAEVAPEAVGYLNAHGTGTPLNDAAEGAAISRWAGAAAARLPVSSTKAGIGHTLGAAGAIEAAVCLLALRGQWLPPETSLETADSACAFPIVREARDATFEIALTNSFGFGGANASLLLRRP
ncbi:MAG TPA: beta-ketoacyl-[acyl-carrier-protein] synthase family protein [Verrucomicrobiota bacterium]|nr:beta-ketoacyl-[acyl-carrier-protein] synthase family protein [Verrucomicrobiales bacterium]HRI16777.1 beta-ketoacyl-[acyl-carrier-protein] synthase family protein [Verrucomicrobiota bacterium]